MFSEEFRGNNTQFGEVTLRNKYLVPRIARVVFALLA